MSQPTWNPPHSPPVSARSAGCQNHPDREGVGICVQCRGVVCVECSTRIDGINYCTRCLEAAQQESQTRDAAPLPASLVAAPLLAAAFVGATCIFFALGYLLALWRQ